MRFSQPLSSAVVSFLQVTLGLLLCVLSVFAQQESPGRGTYPQGAYSLSDIEQINTTNGNVMFHVPVGALPAGRNGLRAAVALHYNSKLYDSWFGSACDNNNYCEDGVQQLYASPTGGWRYGFEYSLQLLYRPQSYACSDPRGWNIFRLVMNFPDGSSHEFRPYGYSDYDGYYPVLPSGFGYGSNCSATTYTTGTMTYFSTDNTHLRLEVQHVTSGPNPWTLFLPNGGRITFNEPGASGQRIYDANNNFVEVQNIILQNGNPANKLIDQLGRSVVIERTGTGVDYVRSPGANGQMLTTTVTWKALNSYYWNNGYYVYGNGFTQFDFGLPFLSGIDQITAPTQAGGYAHTFNYNLENGVADGFGEVASVKLPSAEQNKAQSTYSYYSYGYPHVEEVLNHPVTQKSLKYLRQYDNPTTYDNAANYVTETWKYNIPHTSSGTSSVITSPDGGVVTEWYYDAFSHAAAAISWKIGLVYKVENPNGSVVERLWQPNTPQSPYLAVDINPYVKTEFVSIKNAAGTLVKTAIKDYSYDKNGNLTQQVEYDWVSYGDVPRDGTGKPTGIPGGATVKRVTVNSFNSPTPDASDKTTVTANAYNKPGSPNLRNAIAKSEVRASTGGAAVAYTEFTYDSATTTGNLTLQRSWDSTKGTITTPLTSGNSIAVSHSYGTWSSGATGKLNQTTDANGTVTSFTYDNLNGTGTEVYPTQIVAAYGTSLARTTNLTYELNSGLTLQATDADNSITTKTTYDDLGRPTLVEEGGSGNPLVFLRQTATEYSDALRRVIVRSSKDTKTDGKLMSAQHYDQRGRVRLTRTLESGVANDAADETLGIKVQTRYFAGDYNGTSTANPNGYALTSNPYRADYSYNAGSEPTMGWTRSKSDQGGRVLEVQSYSGATLPAPFVTSGANTTNKGTVVTYYDGEKVRVTDQAGKQRTSATDGLGRLVSVWEAPSNENYLTSYTYDTLDSLTQVSQGGQTRTFAYSSLKRLTSATNPESGTMSYTYDNNGNLLTKTDARSTPITTTYTYDALNRNTTVRYSSYPAGTAAVDRFYDSVTNGKGKFAYAVSYNTETGGTLTYNYDQINNYDKLGRVTSKSQNFLINSGGYTWRPFTTTATYNLAGGMTSETYPSGRTVNYEYDDAGRTTSFRGNLGDGVARNYATEMTYLAAGQLTKEALGKPSTGYQGMTTTLYQRLNYNSRQQLYAVRVGTYNGTTYDNDPQTAQSSQTSSWDRGMLTWRYGSDDATTWGAGGSNNNGNVLRAQHWIPSANSYYDDYEYDNLNRLTKVTEGGNASFVQAFDYDQWGNRTINQTLTTTSSDINKKLFTVNTANNRLGVPSGQPTNIKMEYDGVGNLTNDTWTNPSAGGAMEYDAENHMTSAVNGAHQYRYNAEGKRTRRIIASVGEFWMVYGIGGELVAEYNASTGTPTQTNPAKEYGYRNGKLLIIAEGSNPKWLIQDHLGSTRMEIAQGGNLSDVTRHDYLPFGEELAGSMRSGNGYSTATNTKQKFVGKERDTETGLDYFGMRYLSSLQGRFTGADPMLSSGNALNPQSWNRYVYALNNPVTNIDILGLYTWGTGITDGFKRQFKAWLDETRKARDTYDTNSEEYKALQAALTYYGEDNGQGPEIRVATATPGGAATDGKTVYEGKFKDGKLVGSSVTFSPSGIGDNPAEVVAHEGRHGADEKAFHDAVKIVNGKRVIPGNLDLTRFQMEDRGFEVGQFTAKGLNREYSLLVPDTSDPTVPDLQKDHYLFNPTWAKTDRQALQVSRREYLQIEYKLSEQNQGGKLSERK